ncbi:2-nitropropane dioxygenase [Cryptococcus wingfieldii CBS 7118]|uniref:2-nitropropane dioxygenase n=1 Tax=Cryptococcus wingfieldii CBS 7118 TaxID=1295528 RepID=A0A1E3IFQ9_9TREE|nr:2-nitropropane dioxygenase [Cryptococcus wingfieldii CBS 7118]ODN87440.1 2-nitropropane dioxygenase [Cryptococcus wingfieldii CBS 7118]
MPLTTELTRLLHIKYPIVQGGMQWVGTPPMAAAVARAGGLGMLTALTQPSPDALRDAIKETRRLIGGEKSGRFGVNITLLPSINPPDYAGYARAAMEEGIDIFETAGNNRQWSSSVPKRFVIHKCVTVKHALSGQKMGVDMLSIDGFECAGHPGEEDIGGVVLLARAAKELSIPYVASGGFADGRGLAAALALGASGINMGTRFMCTAESPIHQNIKEKIVASTERDTIHIFRRNTARVFKNAVSTEVVRLERRPEGAKFEDLRELVAGARGKQVYETGDHDAGIWSAGIAVGLIDDIPTCSDLVKRIDREATEVIQRLHGMTEARAKL